MVVVNLVLEQSEHGEEVKCDHVGSGCVAGKLREKSAASAKMIAWLKYLQHHSAHLDYGIAMLYLTIQGNVILKPLNP